MNVHVVDGTYELFRHFYAVPSVKDPRGREIGAVRGVVNSVLMMLERGTTHVGVATDHVIESFRNDLFAGYKTGDGIDPDLLSQFHPLEEALRALGVTVWPMVEFEADDALASSSALASGDERVEQVLICTPDKDLAQCVSGSRVVQLDRRRELIRDEAGVIAKFGVRPESIPDYLALVGDSADGFPGVTGWGEKAASEVLSHYVHLEAIPNDWTTWHPSIRRAKSLSQSLRASWDDAVLFRTLATLRRDVPLFSTIEELRWKGPREDLTAWSPEFSERAKRIAARLGLY